MNQRKRITYSAALAIAFALVAAVAGAQTIPLPVPGGATGTTFTIKSLPSQDGTTGEWTTKYFIDAASVNDMMWIFGQTLTNTQTIQNMKQYAQPVCLVGIGADNANNFDWAGNKMRGSDWSLLSVTSAGIPYRNGVRLGTVSVVRKLCLYGNDVFAKANGDGKWYVWKNDLWTALPTAAIDPTVFN